MWSERHAIMEYCTKWCCASDELRNGSSCPVVNCPLHPYHKANNKEGRHYVRFSSTYISPTGMMNEIILFANDRFTLDAGGGMDWEKVRRIREAPGVVSPAYLFPGGHVVATNRWLLPWFLRGSIGSQLVVFRPRNKKLVRPMVSGPVLINLEPEYEQAQPSPWFTKKVRRAIDQYVKTHANRHTYYLLRRRGIQRVVAALHYPDWADLIFDHFAGAPIQVGTTTGDEFLKSMVFIQAVMDACQQHLVQAMRRAGHVIRFVQPLGHLTHTQHAGLTVWLHVANATRVKFGSYCVLLSAPGGPFLALAQESAKGDLWHTAPQSVSPADNDNLNSNAVQLEIVKVKNSR